MELQPQGFRQSSLHLEEGLERLDRGDRRQVRTVVARLAAQWIGEHGPSHRTLVGEVANTDSTLRLDVFSEPPLEDPRFWSSLVETQIGPRFEHWELDRRRASGVWFELARVG